ncbi:MAG: S8 family peptidase [Flavobacteriales bacterium]|nr:S8 family peptidase [Flavobacteriales bacterium]
MLQYTRTAFLITALISALAINAQEKTNDWFNSDLLDDQVAGISVDKTYATLIDGRQGEEVVVAVIDSGVDIEHEDLVNVIWVNEDEIPDNGIDDDGNGYIDDIHGWSFISGPGGDVHYDNLEFTRVYKELKGRFEGKAKGDIAKEDKDDYKRFLYFEDQFGKRVAKAKGEYEEFKQVVDIYNYAKIQMEKVFGHEDYTLEDVKSLEGGDEASNALRDFMVQALENDLEGAIDEGLEHFQNTLTYSYNLEFHSRDKVGDDPNDLSDRFYGTNRVEGPRADHGTHVAGIIAAERGNGIGIDGVADKARIMVLRVVPDGDERDKDVANAIRYAADNGAKIINMSFGKSYSPDKSYVDEAVKYAEGKGVLMIHAAGNSSKNNEKTNNFPNPVMEDPREISPLWIEVGASGPEIETLASSFTNYGKKAVDVFAPGVDINSTVPDSKYEENSGTSMAAPVVSGLAALIWSYYPELKAKDVKDIVVNSYKWYGKIKVDHPGKSGKEVKFSKLSRTGGVVNAYNAFRMANEKRKEKSES